MAERYLPTELQNNDGDVIYPHTEADIVWTKDGKSVEEVLEEKTEVKISGERIPIEQRKPGALYMFVEGQSPISENSAVMASPAVGYKLI